MNTSRFPLIPLLLAGSLVALPGLAWAQDSHAHGAAATENALTLDQGAKWATDEPLRQGMSAIRDAFSAVIEDVHADKLDAVQYAELADGTEANVDYVVENCKLPEQPDQQLHIVLERIYLGLEQLRTPGSGRDGAVAVIEALNAYGEHFEHPGWKPVAL